MRRRGVLTLGAPALGHALVGATLPERGRVAWSAVRWVLAGAVVALALALLALTIREAPGGTNMPFDHGYGNWRAVLLVSAVFTAFVIGFARPRRRIEWCNAGISTAFFVSLFTEMFGIPLTVFNIQWPTLPTLVMAPLLILAYVGLARREDRDLAGRFGEALRAYAVRTRAFLPSRSEGTTEAANARHPR